MNLSLPTSLPASLGEDEPQLSQSDIREQLQQELHKTLKGEKGGKEDGDGKDSPMGCGHCIEDIFHDHFVHRDHKSDKMYKRHYAINGRQVSITSGPQEVRKVTHYEPVEKSSKIGDRVRALLAKRGQHGKDENYG
jgi:hypothetical protein